MKNLLETICDIAGTRVEDGEFIKQSEQDAQWIAEQRERERRDGEEARAEMPLPDDDYVAEYEERHGMRYGMRYGSDYDEHRWHDDRERSRDINQQIKRGW